MPFSNSLFLSSKQFCLISSQLITLFKQMVSVESHLIYLDKETCWNKQEHLLSEHADILFICTNRRVGWKVALSWHLFTPLSTVWAGSSRQVTDSRWCQSKLAPEAREVKFIFSVLPGENEKTDKFGNMKPIFKKLKNLHISGKCECEVSNFVFNYFLLLPFNKNTNTENMVIL